MDKMRGALEFYTDKDSKEYHMSKHGELARQTIKEVYGDE
jgi:hypothetical protein